MMRGGTSRGVYFRAQDLPADPALRDAVLVAVMGGPDALQVDGVGGGHPLTSKVAVLSPSADENADVDYLFLQVNPRDGTVSAVQNCGNILAGVGGYAIEAGWIPAQGNETRVRVNMLNSDSLCELLVQTPGGQVCYDGGMAIDGVPGTGAAVVCDFLDVAGSTCGALLPTGAPIDIVDGIEVTCIDNGMPVVIIRARDVGISGMEAPDALDANDALKTSLESLRLQIGEMMNLGDVTEKSVPKLSLISKPASGHVSTRTFIPHFCHKSIGVLGAVSVATACIIPETVAEGVACVPEGDTPMLDVEHPTGSVRVRLSLNDKGDVERAGVIRTARRLFAGHVFVPNQVWPG
jgi:4-oxalomesaconate tautomerase